MLIFAILLFLGSLIQLLLGGGTLGVVLVIISGIFVLSTLPQVKKLIFGKTDSENNILGKLLPIIIVLVFLVAGAIFYPYPTERETENQYNKAMGYVSSQKYEKALEIFTDLTQKNPNDSQVFLGMGLLYMNMKDNDTSWGYLNTARQLNPYDVNIEYNMALNRYHVGALPESLQRFESLVQKNPKLIKARLYAGIISMELGNYPRAVYQLEQILKTNTEIPDVYYYLGKCHVAMMEYTKAGEAFNNALDLKPSKEFSDILTAELSNIESYIGGGVK